MAGGPWRRAALGALGWCWLCACEAMTGGSLYVHPPDGLPAPSVWLASPYDAMHHVLAPLTFGAGPAGAAVWALAAVALPVVRSRRSRMLDAARVGLWALGVAAATEVALRLAAAGAMAPGLVVSALGAAVGAVVTLVLRPPGMNMATSDCAQLA
jgi:hypothetical protein